MNCIVLIERYLPSSFFWPNLLKDKRIKNLTVEEILEKYKGFEGELQAFFEIEANEISLKEAITSLKIRQSFNSIMLGVFLNIEIPPIIKSQATFMGYDIGVCEEEKTIYSSIFNEVLFGHLEELVIYKDQLNKHYLFENRELAEEYVCLHNKLSAEGKSVEDYEEMRIYEIWLF